MAHMDTHDAFFFLSGRSHPPHWLSYCLCKTSLFFLCLILLLCPSHRSHPILEATTGVMHEQKHTTLLQTGDNTALFPGAPVLVGWLSPGTDTQKYSADLFLCLLFLL